MTTASVETIQDTLNRVELLCQDIAGNLVIKPTQIIIYEGLSDISGNLGLVVAGEFRAGVGFPNLGFSGMRMAYPGMLYGTDTWHLVGVNNDVLQVGISATTGKLLAGGGSVVLDALGINIKNATTYSQPSSLQFYSGANLAAEIFSFTEVSGLPKYNELFVGTRAIAGNTSYLYLVNEGANASTIQIQASGTASDPYILMNNNTLAHSGKSDIEILAWDTLTLTSQNIKLITAGADPTINAHTVWHAGNTGTPTAWTPTLTGFSADPAGIYHYVLVGKTCTLMVRQYTNGTSSGAGSALTITLPFTAKTVANMIWVNFSVNIDGGAIKMGPVEILSAGTVATVYPDIAYGTWAAGDKRCAFEVTYEIA